MKQRLAFILLSFTVVLTSCIPRARPLEEGDVAWGVEILWHGHSCFTVRDSVGRTLVFDPFDETIGYERLRLNADTVAVTHDHFDHNNIAAVQSRIKNIDLVESTGSILAAGNLLVHGVQAYHDDENGQVHGDNRIYVFEMGGLRIAHLGDFGQAALTPHQRSWIGNVDVLFIPVGGFTTLDAKAAQKIVERLKPGAVFPMHFGDTRFYPLDEASLFTDLFNKEQVQTLERSSVRIRKAELTKIPQIFMLKPTPTN